MPISVDDTYFQQICNVKPNTRMQKDSNGYVYANWAAFGDARRDYFDAEKMCIAALEIAGQYFPATAYSKGHMPLFLARERLLEIARRKKIGKA